MPDDLKNCEYFLVEYAPTALRDTRVSIGLFLFEASGRLVRHALTRDWRQLRCLDPQADVQLLESLPGYFDQLVGESAVHHPPEGPKLRIAPGPNDTGHRFGGSQVHRTA